MLGIPGFKAQFFEDAVAFKQAHYRHLQAVIGYPIQAYYLQWATDDDSWNADAPVIFLINGVQYEFCAFKMNEFHFSINQIDLKVPLDWYGSHDEFPLIWQKNPLESINHILDKKIKAIRLVEWQGLFVGIEFTLATSPLPLCLLNALDENSLSLEQLDESEYSFIEI